MSDYLILGAGISGLSVAVKLMEQGHSVTVFEKGKAIGGLASTTVRDGYRLDIGPHFITSQNDEVLREILELFEQGELVTFSRSAKILFDDRYLDYPLTAKNVFSQMGIKHAGFAAASYLITGVRNLIVGKSDVATFEDWAKMNFGNYLYKIFFKPYTEQFWGISCSQLSVDCIPLVTKMSFLKTLKMLFLSKFQRNSLSIAERETTLPLHYPRKGFGEVANKLAEKLGKMGGDLVVDCRPTRIEKRNGGFHVEYVRDEQLYSSNSPRIISTIPIPVLLGLLEPPPPEDIAQCVKNIKYLSVIVVYLVIGDRDIFDCSYLYILGRPYNRISNTRQFCSSLCPSGQNMIAHEITCEFGDSVWNQSDDELVSTVVNGMTEDGFLTKGEVQKTFVVRKQHAYPFYTVDYKRNLDKAKSFIESIEGLTTIGRTGGFKYMDIDQCIEDASGHALRR